MNTLAFLRRIQGESMSPQFEPGQIVFAVKPWRSLRVNDVIVFQHSGIEKIKRVKTVHRNQLYVLGDNPTASTDSRDFGTVSASSVAGIVLWPKR